MIKNKFQTAIQAIDAENAQDPNIEIDQNISYPKELLYSNRMYHKLADFCPDASDEVKIATKAQHICRWKMPRELYDMNRVGYLKWREELKKFHEKKTANILAASGYDEAFINRVSFLIEKKLLKKDAETQLLEDIICLVFLEYYLQQFVEKHDTEKLKNIILKTWNKKSKNEIISTTDSTTMMNDSANTMNSDSASTATMNSTVKTETDIDLNGTMLKGYAGGMEESMISFLKSGGYKNAADDAALKGTWYNFDKVNFKMGSSTELEAGSQEQMDNLLAILKAFPDAKIKIGGYTDKVGNEASNVKLSQARADYIKKWISDKGVAAQVLDAKGYGSEQATVAATASNEERKVDRKMAVRFSK